MNRNPRQSATPMTTGPENELAAIKEAVDIVSLIGEYLRVEPFGSKYRALCPFHDDKKPSLQIDPEFKNYRCWACGAKGDVFTFLQEYEKISFVEAKERLASRAGIVLKLGRSGIGDSKARLVSVLEWASKEYQKLLMESASGAVARQYLKDRGVTEETIRRYGLGFAPAEFEWLIRQGTAAGFDAQLLIKAGLAKISQRMTTYDVFRGRVMFPIKDTTGRTIGFGGRIVPSLDDGRAPKYLNSPSTDVYNKSRVLYGLDIAAPVLKAHPLGGAAKPRLPVVVMEGYMDCLMSYQAGLLTAVATCGTALTGEHVQRLRGYTDRIVLMFDGDEAGFKAAREATTLFLSSEVDIRLCLLPDGLDPCDFVTRHGVDELRRRIESAPDALEHTVGRAVEMYDSSGLDGRSRAIGDVLEALSAMPEVLRGDQQQRMDLAINRVAEAFRVEESTLRHRLREIRQSSSRTGRSRPSSLEPSNAERPYPPKERTIVELAVVWPGGAGPLLELAPAEYFSHPALRRIMETCYQILKELGTKATTDVLRERLDDPKLDSVVVEFLEMSPKGPAHETALKDVVASLKEDRRRRDRSAQFSLGPTSGKDDHKAALRALTTRSATNP